MGSGAVHCPRLGFLFHPLATIHFGLVFGCFLLLGFFVSLHAGTTSIVAADCQKSCQKSAVQVAHYTNDASENPLRSCLNGFAALSRVGKARCSDLDGMRFVVSRSRKGAGGLGDRLLSVVDLYLVAALTNRTLLVWWTDSTFSLWKYWIPATYELRYEMYSHCFAQEEVSIRDYMGFAPVLKKLGTDPLESVLTNRVEVISKNIGWAGILLSRNPYTSHALYRWFEGDSFPWWKVAFNCLFKPSPHLLNLVRPYEDKFRGENVIGMQVRLFNQNWSTEVEKSRKEEWNSKDRVIEAFLHCSEKGQKSSQTYFVVSDTEEVFEIVKSKIGPKNAKLISVDGTIAHIDLHDSERVSKGVDKVFTEIYLLGLCSHVVVSRASNFGRLGCLNVSKAPLGLDFYRDITERNIDHLTCADMRGVDVLRKSHIKIPDPTQITGILDLAKSLGKDPAQYFVGVSRLQLEEKPEKKSSLQVLSYEFNAKTEGKFWPILTKEVDCPAIWRRLQDYKPATDWPPPKKVPPQMEREFTINGQCSVAQTMYFAQRYSSGSALQSFWNESLIENLIRLRRKGEKMGSYTTEADACVDSAMKTYEHVIKDKVGLVIGSERPWIEALGIMHGAKFMDTLEYGVINSTFSKLRPFLPGKFAKRILEEGPVYDFVFTYSSVEHSGLGRYGDALNPTGDLEAIAQVWCSLKPQGYLFLAVPVANPGTWESCNIFWNAHRHYGIPRYQHLTANFEQVGAICTNDYQPIIVLRKLEAS